MISRYISMYTYTPYILSLSLDIHNYNDHNLLSCTTLNYSNVTHSFIINHHT